MFPFRGKNENIDNYIGYYNQRRQQFIRQEMLRNNGRQGMLPSVFKPDLHRQKITEDGS